MSLQKQNCDAEWQGRLVTCKMCRTYSPYWSGPTCPMDATFKPSLAAAIMKFVLPPTSHAVLGGGAAVSAFRSCRRLSSELGGSSGTDTTMSRHRLPKATTSNVRDCFCVWELAGLAVCREAEADRRSGLEKRTRCADPEAMRRLRWSLRCR